MLRKHVIAGALALACIPSAQAKDWKTVTIALEGMKVECKLIAQDWHGMIASLNGGKFDVIMDALSVTPERKDVIVFSTPYAATPAAFVVSKTGGLAKKWPAPAPPSPSWGPPPTRARSNPCAPR